MEDTIAASGQRKEDAKHSTMSLMQQSTACTREDVNNNGVSKSVSLKHPPSPVSKRPPGWVIFLGRILRILTIYIPLTVLFASLVIALMVYQVNNEFFVKQIKLMVFQKAHRQYLEPMYYFRQCTERDVTATSVDELVIPENATAEESIAHQMTHGVSLFRDLVSPDLAREIREFILQENPRQERLAVIEPANRTMWRIGVNMHPALRQFWKDLAANKVFMDALIGILGPDPTLIEFTAITSSYGAAEQGHHPDYSVKASAAIYPHSFLTGYSLFIPLQNTTMEMGATDICPGSHLCIDGARQYCPKHSISMAGKNNNWPLGWGAFMNEQTVHRGAAHTAKDQLDRVVIIPTFAPKAQTHRALETRVFSQGGTFAMDWSQWGHTFWDFVNAEKRMWEPQKTLRSLGLLKGSGWDIFRVISLRMAMAQNEDRVYGEELTGKSILRFWPDSWQGAIEGETYEHFNNDPWYRFLMGTWKRTTQGLAKLYGIAFVFSLFALLAASRMSGSPSSRVLLGSMNTLVLLHAIVALTGWWRLSAIRESNWAKDIASGKAYRLPPLELQVDDTGKPKWKATIPNSNDILIAPDYAADQLAGYGHVIDFNHPGNVEWNRILKLYGNGYTALSDELQGVFCRSLLDYVRQDARFLKTGNEREWLPILDPDELLDVCHQHLMAEVDPRRAAMARQLNSLRTTAKYGRFRRTTMQRKFTPIYLAHWESILIPPRPWNTTINSGTRSAAKQALSVRNSALPPLVSLQLGNSYKRRCSIPRPAEPHEPFPMAWVLEGDTVEFMPDCASDYYVRGKVFAVISITGQANVELGDGQKIRHQRRICLRRVPPYKVGEKIQYHVVQDQWENATVVKAEGDVPEMIQLANGTIVKNPVSFNILRGDHRPQPLEVGINYFVRRHGGPVWVRGTVWWQDSNGNYDVTYGDTDELERNVPSIRIQEFGMEEDIKFY